MKRITAGRAEKLDAKHVCRRSEELSTSPNNAGWNTRAGLSTVTPAAATLKTDGCISTVIGASSSSRRSRMSIKRKSTCNGSSSRDVQKQLSSCKRFNSNLRLLGPCLCKCTCYWPSFLALYVRHCGLKVLAKYEGQLGWGEGVVIWGIFPGECLSE